MDKAKVNFLCEERADTADLDREIERLHLRLRLDEIRKQQRNENNEDMKEEQKALDYTNRWREYLTPDLLASTTELSQELCTCVWDGFNDGSELTAAQYETFYEHFYQNEAVDLSSVFTRYAAQRPKTPG
ncbi:unnamed protein product, partial [Symbiodinium sp. KB8]